MEHYLRTWNSSEAARQAGYLGEANVTGPRLLSCPVIREQIETRITELEIDPTRVPDHKIIPMAAQVYIIREEHGLVKIGKAVNFASRFYNLSKNIPYSLTVLAVLNTPYASDIEKELHAIFAHRKVKGEWFDLNDTEIEEATKCLYLLNEESLLKNI